MGFLRNLPKKTPILGQEQRGYQLDRKMVFVAMWNQHWDEKKNLWSKL